MTKGESGSRGLVLAEVDCGRAETASMLDLSSATRLATTFKALSDPTRVRLISALSVGEVCVHELARALQISQSAVSHQLRTLREMHLVKFRKEGRHVYYRLDDEHVRELYEQGRSHIEHR